MQEINKERKKERKERVRGGCFIQGAEGGEDSI